MPLSSPPCRPMRNRAKPRISAKVFPHSLKKENPNGSADLAKMHRCATAPFHHFACDAVCKLKYLKTGLSHIEHAKIRNDAVHDGASCQRQSAFAQEFHAAIRRIVFHQHDDA